MHLTVMHDKVVVYYLCDAFPIHMI